MSATLSLCTLLAGFVNDVPELSISGIALDSRRVRPGDLFLACKGQGNTHGLSHLQQAVQSGAAAVAWEPASGWTAPTVAIPQFAVPDLARRAGELASRYYGEPSRQLVCIGITGTDGKTSTAYLIAQALDQLQTPCGYIGTIGIGRVGELGSASHTTPDALSLQQQLAQFRDDGLQACAMEVSSHALDQARVAGVKFDTAVLTNITRDHLDYHGTVDAYAAAKHRLFERSDLRCAVLNRDDARGAAWLQELQSRCETIAYGIEGDTPTGRYVIARDLALDSDGISLTFDTDRGRAALRSRLLGRFNVYNLAAAAAVLLARGESLQRVVTALSQLQTVPGRIEGFRGSPAQPLVVVDYAHTPEALRQILLAVRAHTQGRISCVFGCGGDRDRGKRPLMGAAASALADQVIVTDDNPRSESPAAIVAEILAGSDATRTRVIHDRAEAIRSAITEARATDVVVVAGKGHEDYQLYGSERRSFSDRRFVAQLLGTGAPA